MAVQQADGALLKDIKCMLDEEQALYERGELDDGAILRLEALKVQLDQTWDLLRQRRALREFGRNPDRAKTRPPAVVENYEQ